MLSAPDLAGVTTILSSPNIHLKIINSRDAQGLASLTSYLNLVGLELSESRGLFPQGIAGATQKFNDAQYSNRKLLKLQLVFSPSS